MVRSAGFTSAKRFLSSQARATRHPGIWHAWGTFGQAGDYAGVMVDEYDASDNLITNRNLLQRLHRRFGQLPASVNGILGCRQCGLREVPAEGR